MPRQCQCRSVYHHGWVCLLGPLQSQPRMQMVHFFHADQSVSALHRLSGPRCGTVSRVFVWAARLHSWWSCLQHPRILLWSSWSHWESSKSWRLSTGLPIIIWMPLGHVWVGVIRMPSLQNLPESGWILQWLYLFWKEMHWLPFNNNRRYNNHRVCYHNRGFNNNNRRCYNPITSR